MKKSISLIIAITSILIISSCSGANKSCAAYAKHDTIKQDKQHYHQRPATYSEVQ